MKTIDEACDFIAEWCGEPESRPGAPLAASVPVPHCAVRLNARIGELWRTAKRLPGPILKYETPFLGLLEGQDHILHPGTYAIDENGVVPFVYENQGVWRYGYHPAEVDRLLVSGDWGDELDENPQPEWRDVQASTEDALIYTLLVNMCMQSDVDWVRAPKPEVAQAALWRHAAWTDFDGFWINDKKTLIYFNGWQVRPRLR